jgi:hypothetical protein
MANTPEINQPDIHIIHDGKFYFSTLGGRHPSWCDLKILQGKAKTLVLLSQPRGYIGTPIVNGIKHLATQITNLFGLEPATTIYVQHTPPTVLPPLELEEDDPVYPLAQFLRYIDGPSDEKYERIMLDWRMNGVDEPKLLRYYVRDFPDWKPILPGEAAKFLEELNTQDDESESE